MTVKYLKIDDIIKEYENNTFYLCSIFAPTNGKEENIYTDIPPCKAYIKFNYHALTRTASICSEDGKEFNRNRYFIYMISDNKEELEQEYKRIKLEWFKVRKKYLLEQLEYIEKMEKECL